MDKRQDLKSGQLCKLSVPATIPFVTGNAVGVINFNTSFHFTFYFFFPSLFTFCVFTGEVQGRLGSPDVHRPVPAHTAFLRCPGAAPMSPAVGPGAQLD